MYPSIVRGVEGGAQELGYGVIIGSHPEGSQQETFNLLLEQSRVDALIVASGLVNDKFVRHLAEIDGAPVISVNRRVRGVRASVTVDDAAGARTAVDHLADLGHTCIGGVFGPTSIDHRSLTSLESVRDSWGMRSGYEGGLDLLSQRRRPSAIFAPSLSMGIGVLRAALEVRASVPRELSVIALHDSELAEYLAPPLTTVAMPTEEMGRRASELAVGLIEGGRPQHVMLDHPPMLVRRSTTAEPH
jgi:LacI family transcriptional regulator